MTTNKRRVIRVAEPLTFSKDDVKDAPLTCLTEISLAKFDFGFTAENIFYRSNSMEIKQLKFFHDQKKIDITTSFKSGQDLKMEIKYPSICKLNCCIYKMCGKENFNVKLTVNVSHPPFFGMEKMQRNVKKYVRVNPIEDEGDRSFWKSFVQSTAYHFSFNLEASAMHSFLNQLYQNIPCGITFTSMKVAAIDPTSFKDLDDIIREWDWNIRYDIECIKRCGTKGFYFIDQVLFERNRIEGLTEANARDVLGAMYDHLHIDPSLTTLDFKENEVLLQEEQDENYALIKTVYVTPTRIIATREETTLSCRGLRYLGVENVIQIKFRDENLSWFPHDLGYDIVTPTCRSGIAIANKVFYEFGGSQSLFREIGSYFYAAENKDQILSMYKKLGEFESATAAKMSARMGQYFTSALTTRMQLRQRDVCCIDDILSDKKDSAGNNYCFTDGNGIMSYWFANQIAEHLGIPYVPSVFQIRYAGYKGMLTVAPKNSKNMGGPYYSKLIENDGKYFALFRKSQKKFDVKDDGLLDFDIVQWSKPVQFNLYRTFITVLDYLARTGEKQQQVRDRLRELNNSACCDVLKPLINNKAFLAKLIELPTYCPISKIQTKSLMNEPFWRGIVEASVIEDAKMLANKIQIPLPANLGRTAFGIADYTGKLKEDQVFFQCSKKLSTKRRNESQVICGRVGVTKSPVVHPGDIRFYEAVDIPELRHLIDVLVFPTVGDRPIPDEIGGGDLDGDPYGIFWDEDLLLSKNFDATDFTDLDCAKAPKITLDKMQDEHAKFRSEYLQKRTVEHLSSCYLAISLTQDIDSAECRSMRANADKAVNYPKSGIFGRLLNADEKQIFWPDFMGKDHEPAYKTSHIICELHEKNHLFYQMIKNAVEEAEKRRNEEEITNTSEVNPEFQRLFVDYKKQIQTIMAKHQIKTEAELFANAFTCTSGTLGKQKLALINGGNDTSGVQKQMQKIFKSFRSTLLDKFSTTWRRDMEAKNENILTYKFTEVSSEMVDTAKQFYAIAKEDKTCYSFPWLLWEGLDVWWSTDQEKSKKFSATKKMNNDYHNVFGNEALRGALLYAALQNVTTRQSVNFTKMIDTWAVAENINESVYAAVAKTYFQDYLSQNDSNDENHTVTGGEVFMAFLISQMINNSVLERDAKLQKAAQSALIKLAFFPTLNFFEKNIFEQEKIEQHCIVINIPKCWEEEFLGKYGILKNDSGCEDVAVGIRRTFNEAVKYSVMYRGTIESCEKLKRMLTPLIEVVHSHSMKNTKDHILNEMNKRLQEIFSFQEPLIHSRSAPGRLIRGYSHRSRR